MRSKKFGLCLLAICFCIACVETATEAQLAQALSSSPSIIRNLKRTHPRLLISNQDFLNVQRLIKENSIVNGYFQKIEREGEKLLVLPPVEHVLIGPRMLSMSRKAENNIMILAFLYRINKDQRMADRAIEEMNAVCDFKDWNPSHYLDTAEMTAGVAIGYDWLYDYMSPQERSRIREGMERLGLDQSLPYYEKKSWWVSVKHNWNQVCNGGMTLGALAIADEDPKLASYIIQHAVQSVKLAMSSYAPDGGWPEGPGYWFYGTSYNVMMLASLKTALGSDFGLTNMPGFAETGLFPVYFTGPIGKTFNFSDSNEKESTNPCMFWLEKTFHNPVFGWFETSLIRTPSPLDLLWYSSDQKSPAEAHLPLDRLYKGIHTVFFRSAWDDPNAVFVGFKGGDNRANHSHLDLGSFVLDAEGKRWAMDLGADNYNLPGYFGKERYQIYRLETAAHNTLSINGKNQSRTAVAPVIAFHTSKNDSDAVVNLSAAYAGQANNVMRGIAFLNRRDILVQDELNLPSPSEVVWAIHTQADVELQGNTAVLKEGDQYMTVRILDPKDAAFETTSDNPPPPQAQNHGVTRLVICLPGSNGNLRIVTCFTPGKPSNEFTPPSISPLTKWSGAQMK
jgi:hypothetical protein